MSDRAHRDRHHHLAGDAGARRLVLTFNDAGRLLLVLGIVALVIAGGWSLTGLDGFFQGFPVAAARRENTALRAQQEVLREQALDLARRLAWSVERGRRIARLAGVPERAWQGQYNPKLARAAGDEALIAWLLQQRAHMDRLEVTLTAGPVELGVTGAAAPPPASGGWVSVRVAQGLVVADLGAAGRPGAAPAKR